MNGIININKDKDITSFDVIRKLRKLLKEKAIGHTGTLDPLATGVLVMCVGKATKLAQDIEAQRKTYIATLEFGYKTDTLDITGEILEKKEYKTPTKEEFLEACKGFIGNIEQIPPMYSAIKINGEKLYDLARKGIEVERKPRPVTIDSIDLIQLDEKGAIIKCTVSKGTYIRTLIDDLGEKLGTFATMSDLLRQEVGTYHINKSYRLSEIEKMVEDNDFSFLSKVEDVFKFDKINFTEEKDIKAFYNGNKINFKGNDGFCHIYINNEFYGLGIIEKNTLKPYKYFNVK